MARSHIWMIACAYVLHRTTKGGFHLSHGHFIYVVQLADEWQPKFETIDGALTRVLSFVRLNGHDRKTRADTSLSCMSQAGEKHN